jgi:hypothetical protein
MSNLRKIMQKLAQAQPEFQNEAESPSVFSTTILDLHVAAYQEQLEVCTAPLLQYEWAWLEEYIADLELCLTQPEMLETAGGRPHVEHLLQESQQCQAALQTAMKARAVQPAPHPHAVVMGEHAWEIRQETVKRLWGLI